MFTILHHTVAFSIVIIIMVKHGYYWHSDWSKTVHCADKLIIHYHASYGKCKEKTNHDHCIKNHNNNYY